VLFSELYSNYWQYACKALLQRHLYLRHMLTMLMFSQSLKQNVSLHTRSMIMSLTIMRRTLHTALYTICQTKTSSSTSYLNNVLVKSWIQHSVSLTRASVLFTSKKDIACDCVLTMWVKQYHCEESPLIAVDQWNLKLTKWC
jgi:hypothetical protein